MAARRARDDGAEAMADEDQSALTELREALVQKDKEMAEMKLRHEVALAELELLRQCVATEGSGEMQHELGDVFKARLDQVTSELSKAKTQLSDIRSAKPEGHGLAVVAAEPSPRPLALQNLEGHGTPKGTPVNKSNLEDMNSRSQLWREQVAKENKMGLTPRAAHTGLSYPYSTDQ